MAWLEVIAGAQSLRQTAFGVLTSGIYANWGHAFCKLGERMKTCDFLMCGPQGVRATFAYTLASLRRLLLQRAGIPREAAFSFTLHSLKVTGLSWALQLDIEATAQEGVGAPQKQGIWGENGSKIQQR